MFHPEYVHSASIVKVQESVPEHTMRVGSPPFLRPESRVQCPNHYRHSKGKRWLGSRVVSVLVRCRRARVQIAVATLSGNSLWKTVRTHRAFVHQAAKLVAALLRVARVTAGRPGGKQWQPTVGFMIHVTCRLVIISPPEQWSLQ